MAVNRAPEILNGCCCAATDTVALSLDRRSGAIRAHYVSLLNRRAASRMTKAPGMARANVNPKNGVTCIICAARAPSFAAKPPKLIEYRPQKDE
jgi:hypothetical protein